MRLVKILSFIVIGIVLINCSNQTRKPRKKFQIVRIGRHEPFSKDHPVNLISEKEYSNYVIVGKIIYNMEFEVEFYKMLSFAFIENSKVEQEKRTSKDIKHIKNIVRSLGGEALFIIGSKEKDGVIEFGVSKDFSIAFDVMRKK